MTDHQLSYDRSRIQHLTAENRIDARADANRVANFEITLLLIFQLEAWRLSHCCTGTSTLSPAAMYVIAVHGVETTTRRVEKLPSKSQHAAVTGAAWLLCADDTNSGLRSTDNARQVCQIPKVLSH